MNDVTADQVIARLRPKLNLPGSSLFLQSAQEIRIGGRGSNSQFQYTIQGDLFSAAVLDDTKVNALKTVAERETSNARPRVELGNLYFDAERYDDAIKWYSAAMKIAPNDVNVSTDLGVCYYYANQADKALEQFAHSLTIDPKHAKTLLNLGIVKAFGKQDLDGAVQVWRQVMAVAPNSPEASAAKRALDSLQSAHPSVAQGKGKP